MGDARTVAWPKIRTSGVKHRAEKNASIAQNAILGSCLENLCIFDKILSKMLNDAQHEAPECKICPFEGPGCHPGGFDLRRVPQL